jgi:hypothetical protein
MSKLRATLLLAASAGIVACPGAPQRIDVIASNYAFQSPPTVSPGPALVHLINRGSVAHEVQFYRFRHPVTPEQGFRILLDSTAADSLFDLSGAVLIAAPGDTAPEAIYADLKRGEVWALVCGFRDSANAPRHFRLGMLAILEVK